MSSQKIEPSWCRITTGDTSEVTFRFTIDNFKNRPEKLKESVKSTYFNVNGPEDLKTRWQLEIFPRTAESLDYVGVGLTNRCKLKVEAEFKIDIIDGAGNERETYKAAPGPIPVNSCLGRKMWLKRDKFNEHPDLLPGGNLTVQCMITVVGPQKVLSGSDLDSRNPDLIDQCQKQVCQHLGKVFFDKQFSDIKIQCSGQTFDCHMAILAGRSPVFLAMFQSNMKEKQTKIVTIDDFKARVVIEMLNFIYTGNVSSQDILKELAAELLAAADKYQLDLLKNICEEGLCSTLKVANCVEYLVLGDMYQTFKLKRMALRLVVENLDTITETDVIKDLFKQKPELALEVMKAVKK